MAITINWPAYNSAVATEIRIYASTTKLADDALGTPIATLSGNATSYVWTTPPTDNTVYWLRIAIDRGADSYLSPNQSYGYFANTGPGPQAVVRGDWEYGYFGRVAVAEMLTPSALRTALGIAGAGPNDGAVTFYYKFIINNKIIFVPCGSITWAITWDQIYNLGLMYGVDATGLGNLPVAPSNLTGVNQKKIITIGAYNFLVRTFKGSVLPINQTVAIVNANLEGSEYDLTMGRINQNATLPSNTASLIDDATTMTAGYQGSLTQHLTAATATLRTTLVRSSNVSCDAASGQSTPVQASVWNPVLELQF